MYLYGRAAQTIKQDVEGSLQALLPSGNASNDAMIKGAILNIDYSLSQRTKPRRPLPTTARYGVPV